MPFAAPFLRLTLLLMPALAAQSQTLAEPAAGAPPKETIAAERLIPPAIKYIDIYGTYPRSEAQKNNEGWVQLGYMVDVKGKPFEVTVVDSSGNKAFEDAAVKALEYSRIEPGTLDGLPVESASELKVIFVLNGGAKGANRSFIRAYDALMNAIKASNRSAADAAMNALTVTNLYEDAYVGLASFQYARVWGDDSQQLKGLQRAVAREHIAHYLSKPEFEGALLQILKLDLKYHQYAEAITTWNDLRNAGIDARMAGQMKPLFDQLNRLRSDTTAYDIRAAMPGGTWHIQLFKKHFRARVVAGHISDVKLRCAKGFLRFEFDPDLEYDVESKYGGCGMELDGNPGSEFILTQF